MNKVNSVSFKNFRGLDNLTVPLSQVTMLTGANGSGKTSVLEGLYCLFSETRLDVSWLSRYNVASALAMTLTGIATRPSYNYKLFWDECPSHGGTECSVSASINDQTWSWEYKKAKLPDLDKSLIGQLATSPIPVDSSAEFALWKWKRPSKKPNESIPVFRAQLLHTDGGFYAFPNQVYIGGICRYIDFTTINVTTKELPYNMSKMLTEALKILNPQVTDVRLTNVESGLSVVLNDNESVTLGTLGNGAVKWVSVLLHILNIRAVANIPIIFLIDEMGAGIHYSMMYDIWKYIKAFAKQNPHIQFVFTSHSDDCIRAYCEVFADEDASVVGLYRTIKGNMVATEFTAYDSFQNIINDNWEVRG